MGFFLVMNGRSVALKDTTNGFVDSGHFELRARLHVKHFSSDPKDRHHSAN
jgi:hypothetical protein